jgi:hypothetical protein
MARARAGLAFAASFSVYLVPLVGPHAAWFLGEAVFQAEARKAPGWIAANLAVALTLQTLAAAYFYWFIGKPRWLRAIPLVLAFPFVFWTVQRVYVSRIPAMFLEEPDVAPEQSARQVECTAPDAYMTNFRTPSELWVRYNNQPNHYAVLTLPGCRLADLSLPEPKVRPGGGVDFMLDLTSVIAGGRAIVQRFDTKERKQSWWLGTAAEGGSALLPLAEPAGHSDRDGPPILSSDGQWAAWLETIPDTGPPVLNRVVLHPSAGAGRQADREKVVDLTVLGPATYVLKKLDLASEELVLWKTDHQVTVGFDGTVKHEFGRPAEVRPQTGTYLEMGKCWLAWDAYREDGPYRIEWSLAGGSGLQRVPLGRSIHGAAMDASGKWIAVSVGTSLNIGKAQDAVYVVSAADGHEVYRKYLPPFSRSPVAFLGGGYFAYSDRTGVRVLRFAD